MKSQPVWEQKPDKSTTCGETVKRLTDLDEGVLHMGDALRVHLHLMFCSSCRQIRDDIKRLPEIVKQKSLPDVQTLLPMARDVLKNVISRLPEVRAQVNYREPIDFPVPSDIKALFEKGADLSLQIMEMVRLAFVEGCMPTQAPFLPEPVLAKLPNQESWKWQEFGGARVVMLMGNGDGPRLTLLRAPKGFNRPEHVHIGTEQMLVLEGLLEDGDKSYPTGSWIHFGNGSIHAPVVLNEECWCLIREEGKSRYTKFSGWLRNLGILPN